MIETRVTFPDGGDQSVERRLLARLDEFGKVLAKDYGVAKIEWWTDGGTADASLHFKATMPDGVFFEAAVSPIMFAELLTDAPLDDFFDHMNRELTMRVDEWKRGLHTPQPPDLMEHVIAFRQWKVDWTNLTLGPIGIGGSPWTGPVWQTAECRNNGGYGGNAPYGHRAPHPHCHCGLYALHDFPESQPPAYGSEKPSQVWGVVQAKGRMEVHSDGIRAEFARPVMLAMPGITQWFIPKDPTDPSKGGKIVPDGKDPTAIPVEPEGAESVKALAKHLGLDYVAWDYLLTKASEYGKTVPQSLRP